MTKRGKRDRDSGGADTSTLVGSTPTPASHALRSPVNHGMQSLTHDVIGQRFGRLLVIADGGRAVRVNGGTVRMWICKCDCGEQCTVNAHSMIRGLTRSCGCLRVDSGRWIGKSGMGAAARFGKTDDGKRYSLTLAKLLGYPVKET